MYHYDEKNDLNYSYIVRFKISFSSGKAHCSSRISANQGLPQASDNLILHQNQQDDDFHFK